MKRNFLPVFVVLLCTVFSIKSQINGTTNVANKLKKYAMEVYSEKVYVHLSINYFSTG